MKKTIYYVCPVCGAMTVTTGQGELSCCGRKLVALVPQKAAADEKLRVEKVEDEWFITSGHPINLLSRVRAVFIRGKRVQD